MKKVIFITIKLCQCSIPWGTQKLIIEGIIPDIVKRSPNTTDFFKTLLIKLPLIGSGDVFCIESKKPHKAIEMNSYMYIDSISIGRPVFIKILAKEKKPIKI